MKDYILITGGAGYIGSHVNKLLASKGYEAVVIDDLSAGHEDFVKWGEFIKGDVGDEDLLWRTFSTYNIEAVMHFVAHTNVRDSVEEPQRYLLNNVVNTITLLRVMMNFGVMRFVFSSSCAVYGLPSGGLTLEEGLDMKPANPYGVTKAMVERILADYDRAYGLKSISLRYFNAAGADPDGEIGEDHWPETHLIPNIIFSILHKQQMQIYGDDYDTYDGTCVRDYVHVSDLAEAHRLALERLLSGKESDCYNLGNGCGFSVLDVIQTVSEVTEKKVEYEVLSRREGDPPVLVADSRKAYTELGWEPEYKKLDNIVETAWKWHKYRHG